MKKDIKDYLHLYLGCEVKRGDYPVRQLGAGLLHDLLSDEKVFEYKPILRPLSDMTEEEKRHYDSIVCENYKGAWIAIADNAERIKFLLSKHFDLFGLIDEKLALDKTKNKRRVTMFKKETYIETDMYDLSGGKLVKNGERIIIPLSFFSAALKTVLENLKDDNAKVVKNRKIR